MVELIKALPVILPALFALLGLVLLIAALISKPEEPTAISKNFKIPTIPTNTKRILVTMGLILMVGGTLWVIFLPSTSITEVDETPTATPTLTNTSTPTVTPTSTPHIIDTMDSLSGWKTSFCDDLCGGANGSSSIDVSLVSGRTNNAIEISYDVKKYGWVVIEKNIKPSILSEITGISFYYRGGDVSNTPNTIELKLMLRYLDDVDETVFGVLWYGATNAGTDWKLIEVPFGDFTCWWPDANCDKHEELDLTNVLRLSFAISNKPEYRDEDGIGEIAFDDVLGLQP